MNKTQPTPPNPSSPQAKKLLDQYRETLRVKQYSRRTEETYTNWVRQFILYHNKRHPRQMGVPEINQFITHLVVERHISASTQNQALSAILFLYRHVLAIQLDEATLAGMRPSKSKRVPTVLSKAEALAVIQKMNGIYRLMAQIMYGSGLRLMECLRLRVKDLDFQNHQIIVRDGKGGDDRLTMFPDTLLEPLRLQLKYVQVQHQKDLAEGYGIVYIPNASTSKYPNAAREFAWQYVFPAPELSIDPVTGLKQRHHIHETSLQKAVHAAAKAAGMSKPVSPHTFRHTFATHLLQNGYDIRTVQELLGHKDVKTTMIYTHVLQKGAMGVKSPLD